MNINLDIYTKIYKIFKLIVLFKNINTLIKTGGQSMKRLSTVMVLVLLTFAVYADGVKWFEGSLEDAKAKAKSEGKLILIDFYSDG